MTAFTSVYLTATCDHCRQEFVLYLVEPDREPMETRMATDNVRAWLKHGHFCPGPPESNDLTIPSTDREEDR